MVGCMVRKVEFRALRCKACKDTNEILDIHFSGLFGNLRWRFMYLGLSQRFE